MNGYLLPFLVALAVFSAGFLALDAVIMNAQGLSLIFSG